MLVVGIDMGHPDGCGANGFMSETDGNRAVGNLVIAKLQAVGITVVDCTIRDNNNELGRRVAKANAQHLDYFVSLHLDSYKEASANGATIYITSNSGARSMAQEIINLVAPSCGYTNRGLKFANFYVLANTDAPAMLIEMGFVSNQGDCNKFNAESLANAIVKGLTGQSSSATPQTIAQPVAQVVHSSGNDWIRRLQSECNAQGFSNQAVDGFSGINTINGCPMLRQGATGNITRLLQEKLNSLGYGTNGIDGIFGSGSKNAIVSFQNNNSLSADGIFGRASWSKILSM